jgi:hypothetical protein
MALYIIVAGDFQDPVLAEGSESTVRGEGERHDLSTKKQVLREILVKCRMVLDK